MNMYSKNKNSRWQKRLIAAAVVVIFMIPLIVFESPIKNIFYYFATPLLEASWTAGASSSGFFTPLLEWKSLALQRNGVQKENEMLLARVASLQDSLKEFQQVKQVGENTAGDNFKLVAAQALGQDTSSDIILIDKGFDQGIAENMPVISSTKVVYGKVIKVYKGFSQVMLISNKSSVVDVK